MNEMENHNRAFLERIIIGEDLLLTDDIKNSLSKYFYMNFLVADCHKGRRVFSPSASLEFYKSRFVPFDTNIIIFKYTFEPDDIEQYNKQTYCLTNDDRENQIILNATNIILRFGYSLIQLVTVPNLNILTHQLGINLNPGDEKLRWPPPTLSWQDAWQIRNYAHDDPHQYFKKFVDAATFQVAKLRPRDSP